MAWRGKGSYDQEGDNAVKKHFINGRSTRVEVDALIRSVPISPGSVVSYDDVALIAETDKGTTRFKTVTDAWRKRVLQEHGLRSIALDGQFTFLDPDADLDCSIGDIRKIKRAARRANGHARRINAAGLSTPEKRQQHINTTRVAQALDDAARSGYKEIFLPGPVQSHRPKIE